MVSCSRMAAWTGGPELKRYVTPTAPTSQRPDGDYVRNSRFHKEALLDGIVPVHVVQARMGHEDPQPRCGSTLAYLGVTRCSCGCSRLVLQVRDTCGQLRRSLSNNIYNVTRRPATSACDGGVVPGQRLRSVPTSGASNGCFPRELSRVQASELGDLCWYNLLLILKDALTPSCSNDVSPSYLGQQMPPRRPLR